MACLSVRMKEGRRLIHAKSDEVLLRNVNDKSDTGDDGWYLHRIPYHRFFMRECCQEAHRRGLKLPKFNPYA